MPTYHSVFLYVNLEPRVPLSGTRAEVIFLLLVLPGHWTTLLLSDVLTNLAWDGLAGLLGNLPTLLYWLKSTLKEMLVTGDLGNISTFCSGTFLQDWRGT